MPRHKEYWNLLEQYVFSNEKARHLFSQKYSRYNNNWCNLCWETINLENADVHIVLSRDTRKKEIRACLYLFRTPVIQQILLANEDYISSKLGEKVSVTYATGSSGTTCYIGVSKKENDIENSEYWNEHMEWMLDRAILLKEAYDELIN